ncbi:amyloid beta A4 protein, partial [Trichonephila clavata]
AFLLRRRMKWIGILFLQLMFGIVSNKERKGVCSLPRLYGNCAGMFSRWYFEDLEKRCYNFVFSGCGGNKNNFKTHKACMRKCVHEKERKVPKKKDAVFSKLSGSKDRRHFSNRNRHGTRRRRYHMF